MTDQEKLKNNVLELSRICHKIRRDIIEMIKIAGSGHPGGSLSATEILTCLYFQEMRIRPDQPDWPYRDRFILSKGHAAPALYAVLAERGFFPIEELWTFSAPGTRLQKHIDMQLTPGTELSTGSLGQAFSVAVGMALANRIDKRQSNVYVLLGDGEIQEGQIWEAAMAAGHQRLDNMIAFLDYNNCQVDGYVEDICSVEPVFEKWESFGWHVQEIDGHDIAQILSAIHIARDTPGKPHMIIAKTIKGKAISFMENRPEWHARSLDEAEYRQALIDLDAIQTGQAERESNDAIHR